MNELKKKWLEEESIAHIHGWDFSHLDGRYNEGDDIPWSYKDVIHRYLKEDMCILDYDTGGGEFLLSLHHSYYLTSATEGFMPNVELCKSVLLPLGIDFKECSDCSKLPFEDESFDIVINRHGDFNAKELYRVLKKGGLFITQQVGEDNERDLVEMVLPNLEKPFPGMCLTVQKKVFEDVGFEVIESDEFYGSIEFYDIGAFVWFARIIEWEFVGFSVDACYDRLVNMHQKLIEDGCIKGTTHRYYMVCQK
ncbi:MAG: class I SAM-dependent methyltransferase [Erysipelotrichaceae bacterium]|nr:class I SAM-dependent methyltransferase [Erysipelotrichaceae bacterium]